MFNNQITYSQFEVAGINNSGWTEVTGTKGFIKSLLVDNQSTSGIKYRLDETTPSGSFGILVNAGGNRLFDGIVPKNQSLWLRSVDSGTFTVVVEIGG